MLVSNDVGMAVFGPLDYRCRWAMSIDATGLYILCICGIMSDPNLPNLGICEHVRTKHLYALCVGIVFPKEAFENNAWMFQMLPTIATL